MADEPRKVPPPLPSRPPKAPRVRPPPPPISPPAAPPTASAPSPVAAPTPLPRPSAPAPSSAAPSHRSSAPEATEVEDSGAAKLARDIIKTCEAELRRGPDDAQAARLHHEIARAHELDLGDAAAARRHYNLALERLPSYVPSIRGARRLALSVHDHRAATALFDAEIRLEPDPHRKAYLYLAKGRVLEDHARQSTQARDCYATAARLDPTNLSVLGALIQVEQAAGEWGRLADALGQAAAAVRQEGPHRAALVARRARIHESRLEQNRNATELYEYALRMDPATGGARQALKRLLLEQERWQELISVLGREAEQSEDLEIKTMALYRIGRIFAEHLGDRDQAIRALTRAAELSPTDHLVLDELARLHEAAADDAALVGVLERLVETIEAPARRLSLLGRIADLYAGRLEDRDSAIRWHEAALRIDPTYVPALRALSRLYADRGSWGELVRMYLEEAAASRETERKAAAHARVGELLETRLDEPGEAAQHHARALGLVPDLESSFKALTRLYSESGQYRALVELYERQVERARQPDVANAYLLKIGSLLEDALQEPAEAIGAYRRVLQQDPKHLGAIHALQRAASSSAQHDVLVEALELELELIDDDTRSVEIRHRAGDVLAEKLDRPDAALKHYEALLSIDPAHRPCLASLGRLHHRRGRWNDLLDVYEQELAIEEDRGRRVRMYVRMAEIAEHDLAEPSRALGYYRAALELDPGSIPVLHALAHRLHERKEWTNLVEVLETELRGLEDADDRASVAYQLGTVLEQNMEDLDRAVEAYRRSIEARPRYRPALDALARIHARQGAWPGLVDLLKKEASEVRDPQLAIEALLRSGEILSDRMGKDEVAIEPYEAIRRSVPGHLTALLSLEPLYRKKRDWVGLAEIHRSQAAAFTDSAARAAALVEVGRLIATHKGVGDRSSAQDAYLAALEHAPDHLLALEQLEVLALELGDRSLLAEVDTRRLAAAGEREASVDSHIRLAAVLEETRPERAADEYAAALEVDRYCLAAIRGLARLAEVQDDASALVEALRAEAEWTADPERAAEILVRAARTSSDHLADPEGATADLERALVRHPAHVLAAEELAEHLRARGEYERLVTVLTAAANACNDPARAAELWRDVALVHADDTDNLAAGIRALERVTAADPGHVPTLSELARLYERNEQWREAAETLRKIVDLGPRRAILADIRLRLARVLVERLDERAGGHEQLDALLRIDGNNRAGLALLLELHVRDGDFKGASAVGKRLLSAAPTGPERAGALLTVGRAQLRAGETEAAAETLYEAVAFGGPTTSAAAEYRALLGTDEPWERYVAALRHHRRQIESGASSDPLHPTLIELARVQHEQLNDHEAAFRTLRDGIGLDPGIAELHAELGNRLLVSGRHAESVEVFQSFVVHHPARAAAWRGLAAGLDALGQSGDAAMALAPLVVLGDASDEERVQASRRKLRPGLARAGSFSADQLRTISAGPGIEAHVEAVLGTLHEALAKLYPLDLDSWGVSSRDKLGPRDEHPTRALCDRMAPAFGIERFDLYVHGRPSRNVSVELSVPACIMVPEYVTRLDEAQQVFLLARAFAHLVRGVHPVVKLGPERAGRIVAAAARGASPSYARGSYDEDALEEKRRQILKAMSRRGRRALDEAAAGLVSAPRVKMEELAGAFALSANRAAALLAGDLPACVDVLRQLGGAPDARGSELLEQSSEVADLFRFWGSAAAQGFRQRSGLT